MAGAAEVVIALGTNIVGSNIPHYVAQEDGYETRGIGVEICRLL